MNYKDLRQRARDNLAGNWALSMAVAAVAVLVGGIGVSFLPDLEWEQPISDTAQFRLSIATGLKSFFMLILGGTLELGYCKYLLKQHDKGDFQFKDLFCQFDRFGIGFAQRFLRDLYCFLWGLLLIVPGIVKYYAYAMTPYILTDHPELTVSQAITRSKEMMEGHKGDLFVLNLTFFGWALLAGLCLNLGNLMLNPYRKAAEAAFYRELAAKQSRVRLTGGDFTG